MKIKLHRLILHARKEDFEIPFSDSITYFYGKVGAGKSTIPRLINFCLGGDIKETPALQHEFVSASLELNIGNHHVKLDRQKGANNIIAAWRKLPNGDPIAMQIPIQATRDEPIIPNTKVENISDLIFHLSGLEPPFVLKSKHNVDTELVRLSFRDLMWYCYLDQDHIDNSFFYLEYGDDFFRRTKSQDAMRFILGFQYEEIAKLESELIQAKQDRSSNIESAEQLRNFLEENGIKNTDDILKQIKEFENALLEIKNEISKIHEMTFVQNHPADELKEKSRGLGIVIDLTKQKIEDVEFQISNQSGLKSEFITANMKIDRTSAARQVFKNIHFETCPQCGQHLKKESSDEVCSLCKRPGRDEPIDNLKTMNSDLIERIKEIDYSINQLVSEKNHLQLTLKSKLIEKSEIDEHLVELQRGNDSKYLTQASELLQRKGIVEGKIQYLKQMLVLPQKVDLLEKEAGEISVKIDKLKRSLEKEKEEASKHYDRLHELEKIFADTLRQVKFPGIRDDDVISISSENYIPIIKPKDKNDPTFTSFSNIGSGGKKTIFKACFALALHRLASKIGSALPTFLIIDTPMKNISERENKDVFNGFYQFVYKLANSELKDRQIIIIDKEYYEESKKVGLQVLTRHMTPDDSKNPPLIKYYRGL